jgi:hypothetical protein
VADKTVLTPNAQGGLDVGPPGPVSSVSCDAPGTCIKAYGKPPDNRIFHLVSIDTRSPDVCGFCSPISGCTYGTCCSGSICAGNHCIPESGSSSPPTSTNATFFQPGGDDVTCGTPVATGTLNAGSCLKLTTFGVSVQQVAGFDCTFALYTGTQSCDAGAAGVSVTDTDIPAGEGQTCVKTGVQDGGEFQKASGIWSCK